VSHRSDRSNADTAKGEDRRPSLENRTSMHTKPQDLLTIESSIATASFSFATAVSVSPATAAANASASFAIVDDPQVPCPGPRSGTYRAHSVSVFACLISAETTVCVSLLATFANITRMTFDQGGDVAVPY
jgi:hypothetical protein